VTRKFGRTRREAFLAALRQSGNQTLAAERAKVSRSWVLLHRSSDPDFRRLSDAAIAAAKQALARPGGAKRPDCKPPGGWGFLDGEELVVRGTRGAAEAKRVQIARARLRQWTPRVEARFLATLTATCNVKAACAEVGLSPASAYNHRGRWPAFARRWDEAIQIGYSQIEMGLIQAGSNLFSDDGAVEARPISAMTADHAIHLLHMHKHQVHRIGRRPGGYGRPPDMDDVRASILRKIEAIERYDARRLANDRKEWARRRECGRKDGREADP
jgi:hypothetical protein